MNVIASQLIPTLDRDQITIFQGDCRLVLAELPANSVHLCVTSPPYWGLRDYGVEGQLGQEPIHDCGGNTCGECYVCHLVEVFAEVHRVLREDGTLWLNLGDTFASAWPSARRNCIGNASLKDGTRRARPSRMPPGLKEKDLVGIPWRVALALQSAGWFLRCDVIWAKRNAMPESVRDRPTRAHEYLFLFSKSERYYYDADAIREPVQSTTLERDQYARVTNSKEGVYSVAHDHETPSHPWGRNRRSVWTIASRPYHGAHFAVFPPDLVEPCIRAGTSDRGCCPTCGSPWERVVHKEREFMSGSGKSGRDPVGKQPGKLQGGGATRDIRRGPVLQAKTLGWQPTCGCDGRPPVPAVVLDPFLGSGTTAAVGQALGRRTIGIELNADYCQLAAERFPQRLLFAGK